MEVIHSHSGFERGNRSPSEPADSTVGRLPGVLRTGQPYQSFQASGALLTHEYMLAGPTG